MPNRIKAGERKLALAKETLRRLSSEQLVEVVGMTGTCQKDSATTCPGTDLCTLQLQRLEF